MSAEKLVTPLAFIFIIIIVLFVLWQSATSPSGNVGVVRNDGWQKWQPWSSSIAYKANGSFEVKFENVRGTTFNITSLTINETISPANCTDVRVNGQALKDALPLSVESDGSFVLTAVCGDSNTKAEGDLFDVRIAIISDNIEDYCSHITWDFSNLLTKIKCMLGFPKYNSYAESGYIRGPVEA